MAVWYWVLICGPQMGMKWQTRIANNFIRSTLHLIAPNISCVGAGTAADSDKTADLISSQLALLRMDTHSQSRVVTAVTMIRQMLFWYQGHTGASYVLGGCNVSGCHLFETHSHGSTGKMPFTSSGSGGLAAMTVLELSWRDGMTETKAVDLVKQSILAGNFTIWVPVPIVT